MSSVTYRQPAASADANSAQAVSSAAGALGALPPYTAIWLVVGAISMSFAALTSALIVRQDIGLDWQPFVLPPILYLNTAVLLASSFSLELARKQSAAACTRRGTPPRSYPRRWFYVTIALALLFVLGQILAWRKLAAQGLFLATNPSSSFFYLFTGLHGLHVLGGVLGLFYAKRRAAHGFLIGPGNALNVAAVYWHFMAILWVYLLLILRIRM